MVWVGVPAYSVPEHVAANAYLAALGLRDEPWMDAAIAASIFVISLIVAAIVARVLYPLALRFTQWTPTDLDSRIVRALRVPVTLEIVVLGAYLALSVPLELTAGEQRAVDTVAGALAIVLGVVAVSAVLSRTLDWYVDTAGTQGWFRLDARLLPLVHRMMTAVVYLLGGLVVLDQLNINISPLIAALGLGGLAVALAIQPTLANLFAGTYVMTEGAVSPGDYIELEGGVAGYVINVGWRSVRLRTWGNNMVVVPNSKFAENIITNYQRPVPAVNVFLECGVSYDNDLYQVEQVCKEVMDEVLDANPDDGVKEYGGWFGFQSFGDSNVNFWLFVQSRDRLASYRLRTALIERLHWRLKKEGIVINYPVRTLQFPRGITLQAVAGEGDGTQAHGEQQPADRPPGDQGARPDAEDAGDQ